MPPERDIYLLDPQKLDPETIAVAFARTSRSPQSFRKIAAELTAEKSAEFHEKWVVGYGHSSVAEHAVLHVAIENVSRLAVESIESNRLASYTEKSTRYQKWSATDFYTPPELAGDEPLRARYQQAVQALFAAYLETLPAVKADVERDFPRQPDESEAAWERRIRSEYVDVCRFLLPAASLANLGMTINARALEHALRKMMSHPLQEVQEIGDAIKRVAMESIPTLIKYVERVPYMSEAGYGLAAVGAALPVPADPGADWCRLVDCDPQSELRVLAAALYRFGQLSYTQALAQVQAAGDEQRAHLAQALLGGMQRHDVSLRETEFATYTFDVLIDQGGYFELKRHRMMTQSAQPLTTRLGYAIPRRIEAAGMKDVYCRAMDAAQQAYEDLAAVHPQAASYLTPNGFNRRVLLGCNWRSLDHFVSLRAAPNAHFSMRRLAQRMAEQARAATPLLGSFLRVPAGETWQQIEHNYFARC